MKLYNKLLEPHGEAGGQPIFSTPIEGPVIVCSIEELREMWDSAYGYSDDDKRFTDYLKEKGIIL